MTVISVVIPVKDGGDDLRRCLEALNSQAVDEEVEIVIVDSGSEDGTPELARAMGAHVHEIPAADFNHGETRNLGARLASGDVIVYTVDDALPVDDSLLRNLTAPLRDEPGLAATFGRHLPREGAPPHQVFYIDARYGPKPRRHTATNVGGLAVSQAMFSNVASAIRRDVLDVVPFASDIVIAEDAEWCSRALRAGHDVAYVPTAVVRHSHIYSLGDTVKRYFDLGAAADRSVLSEQEGRSRSVKGSGARFVRKEIGWMWRSGYRREIPSAIAHEGARYTGFQLGSYHRFVPKRVRSRISRTSVYWSR